MAEQRISTRDIYELLERMESKFEKNFVTKTEFQPVKTIAYGLVGLILTTVVAALLAQVIRAWQ